MASTLPGSVSAYVGVVVIGRNEGDRLRACFASLAGMAAQIVYVDSGSSDGSVEAARAIGAHVVDLDVRSGFTAARARNEGFRRLREIAPGLPYVQFVDGDCEVASGWMARAMAWLEGRHDAAVACGRRRERYPDRSVYNMLCDIEWDTPVGEAKACGGDALMRAEAFEAVGGFRADLIAGEEPELCVRLRAAGWRIWRLDAEMTVHDAGMTRIGQWGMRTVRAGFAYAQGRALHGAAPERHGVRESRSAWIWAAGIPLAVLGLMPWLGWWAAALLLVYPAQIVRLAVHGTRSTAENWWRAAFLVLGKFPEFIGQLKFLHRCYFGGKARLIEYK